MAVDLKATVPGTDREAKLANPAIDMPGYIKVAQEAEVHRRTRRVTEEEFIKMSGEKDTIILDARSKQMYDLLHVKGAINLNFSDIDAVTLPKTLPDKNVRILIYCNNNFTPAAPERADQVQPVRAKKPDVAARAFQPKMRTASLNVSTYTALYNYGYKNVYELAPLLDVNTSKIVFESNSDKK
ncbi:MAG: sulfurtransferase [Planctomycetaceae bacterium]|nr:sulfurtransferase [Planctomycetaceae bacterium]